MTPIFLFDDYMFDFLREDLIETLEIENAQALGLPFRCNTHYIEHHSFRLETFLLQKNGDIRKSTQKAKSWADCFIVCQEEFQYPLWHSTQTLCNTLGGGQMTLMAWFFEDKLVVERIDAPSEHLHIALLAHNLSHHQKMSLGEKNTQIAQNWISNLNLCQLLPTPLDER